MNDLFIGKHVIVRSDAAGVYFGIVKKIKRSRIVLRNARIIRYWEGALDTLQIAVDGLCPDKSEVGVVVPLILINTYDAVIECTEKAIEILNNVKVWKIT